jgi:hypothetical protein
MPGTAADFVLVNPWAGTQPRLIIGQWVAAGSGTLDVARGRGTDGTAVFRGTTFASHFNYDTAEDTYIRGGKSGSKVFLNDSHNGNVIIVGGGGNVGIGISPSRLLHVGGSAQIDDGIAAPSTAAAGAVTNRYGGATNFCGNPNAWLRIYVSGTAYKIPLYT